MTFGQIISDARKKAKLSQKELAALITKEDSKPISPQYLNDLEHDRRKPPGDILIRKFAKVLNLELDRLLVFRVAADLYDDVEDAEVDAKFVGAFKAFRKKMDEKRK